MIPGSRLSPTSGTAAALVRGPFADAALGTLGTAHRAAGAAAWGEMGERQSGVSVSRTLPASLCKAKSEYFRAVPFCCCREKAVMDDE